MLHKLGLNYVQERILRCHYGIVSTVPFDEKQHPHHLQFTDFDGQLKCGSVMDWFVKKVVRLTNIY